MGLSIIGPMAVSVSGDLFPKAIKQDGRISTVAPGKTQHTIGPFFAFIHARLSPCVSILTPRNQAGPFGSAYNFEDG